MNAYQEHGFSSRKEYLQNLAEEHGVDVQVVYMLAQMLGPEEDFDGLVVEIEDYSMFRGSDGLPNHVGTG